VLIHQDYVRSLEQVKFFGAAQVVVRVTAQATGKQAVQLRQIFLTAWANR
jgi:hypothetical protein